MISARIGNTGVTCTGTAVVVGNNSNTHVIPYNPVVDEWQHVLASWNEGEWNVYHNGFHRSLLSDSTSPLPPPDEEGSVPGQISVTSCDVKSVLVSKWFSGDDVPGRVNYGRGQDTFLASRDLVALYPAFSDSNCLVGDRYALASTLTHSSTLSEGEDPPTFGGFDVFAHSLAVTDVRGTSHSNAMYAVDGETVTLRWSTNAHVDTGAFAMYPAYAGPVSATTGGGFSCTLLVRSDVEVTVPQVTIGEHVATFPMIVHKSLFDGVEVYGTHTTTPGLLGFIAWDTPFEVVWYTTRDVQRSDVSADVRIEGSGSGSAATIEEVTPRHWKGRANVPNTNGRVAITIHIAGNSAGTYHDTGLTAIESTAVAISGVDVSSNRTQAGQHLYATVGDVVSIEWTTNLPVDHTVLVGDVGGTKPVVADVVAVDEGTLRWRGSAQITEDTTVGEYAWVLDVPPATKMWTDLADRVQVVPSSDLMQSVLRSESLPGYVPLRGDVVVRWTTRWDTHPGIMTVVIDPDGDNYTAVAEGSGTEWSVAYSPSWSTTHGELQWQIVSGDTVLFDNRRPDASGQVVVVKNHPLVQTSIWSVSASGVTIDYIDVSHEHVTVTGVSVQVTDRNDIVLSEKHFQPDAMAWRTERVVLGGLASGTSYHVHVVTLDSLGTSVHHDGIAFQTQSA